MAQLGCRSIEGWGPVSQQRQFDLTPCFEEGGLQSTILILFAISAAFSCWTLGRANNLTRSRKSVWILRGKLVRAYIHFIHSLVFVMSSLIGRILDLACISFGDERNEFGFHFDHPQARLDCPDLYSGTHCPVCYLVPDLPQPLPLSNIVVRLATILAGLYCHTRNMDPYIVQHGIPPPPHRLCT